MLRMVIFGKDCERNLEVLAHYLKVLENTVVSVGVESFYFLLKDHGINAIYYPRLSNNASYLTDRLGRLLLVDYVCVLPVRGRMTDIEVGMAEECGFEIHNLV